MLWDTPITMAAYDSILTLMFATEKEKLLQNVLYYLLQSINGLSFFFKIK